VPDEIRTEAREIIDAALVSAARCIVGLMEKPGRNAIAQLAAAKDILERGGVQALNKVQLTGADGGSIKIVVDGVEGRSDDK
jgi:hypothetical protein